jgi:hypothetical protein
MCFNQPVSIATYMVGMIGSIQLFQRGRIPEAIFFALVIQMQLIEFFLWSNQPCTIPHIANTRATQIGIILNHIQPFVLWFAILGYSSMELPTFVNVFMIGLSLFTIHYTIGVYRTTKCTTVTPESNPHLHWKWNEGNNSTIYYALFVLALVMLFAYGVPNGKFTASLVVISYGISYYIYRDRHSVGALWCFAAAFAPWILNYSRAS